MKSITKYPQLRLYAILMLLMLSSVKGFSQERGNSSEALAYFDKAFNLIANNFYRANEIDFGTLRNQALLKINSAKVPADTYEAISFVVAALNDKHSHFKKPRKQSTSPTPSPRLPAFKTYDVSPAYGALELYSYSSLDTLANLQLADSIYSALKRFGKQGKTAIVVDLRKMEGGSLDPFLCPLAALIKERELFTLVGRYNQRQKIYFDKGKLIRQSGKSKLSLVYLKDYQPKALTGIKVYLITGPYTASVGEQLVIALKGSANVTVVGRPTYGVPTGAVLHNLSDGASIALASSVPHGRDGKAYAASIAPDMLLDLNPTDQIGSYLKVVGIK